MMTAIAFFVFGHLDLGSNKFYERERASRVMADYWPLTEPVLKKLRADPDLEVRTRAKRATPSDWLTYQQGGLYYLIAKTVITGFQDNGSPTKLPWIDFEIGAMCHKNKDIDAAILKYAMDSLLLKPGEQYWPHSTTYGLPIACADLDRLRFRAFGLGESAWIGGFYTDQERSNMLIEWEKRFARKPHISR